MERNEKYTGNTGKEDFYLMLRILLFIAIIALIVFVIIEIDTIKNAIDYCIKILLRGINFVWYKILT